MIFYIALIVYCTLVYGLHGGEGITGINRQVRNLLCAIPFGVVMGLCSGFPACLMFFAMAFLGVNLGFDFWPLWFKGFVNYPFGGFIALPLVYWLAYKTRWTNVLAEYASGTVYGLLLVLTMVLKGV